MDYSTYQYDDTVLTTTDASGGFLAGIGLGMMLVYLAVLVLMLVAMWKIFAKAGKPGWASIVPIYNIVVLLQIVGRPVWWVLLYLIPFVNIIPAVIVTHDLAKSFGKDVVWTIGLLLLGIVFYPLLAFSKDAKYVGPAAASHAGPGAPVRP